VVGQQSPAWSDFRTQRGRGQRPPTVWSDMPIIPLAFHRRSDLGVVGCARNLISSCRSFSCAFIDYWGAIAAKQKSTSHGTVVVVVGAAVNMGTSATSGERPFVDLP
jgi:hypothetical protein